MAHTVSELHLVASEEMAALASARAGNPAD